MSSAPLVYSLREFCRASQLDAARVRAYVDHGVIESGRSDRLVFSDASLDRCLRAERLRREFELNAAGVALVMQLLDRNRQMHRRLEYLEQLADRLCQH